MEKQNLLNSLKAEIEKGNITSSDLEILTSLVSGRKEIDTKVDVKRDFTSRWNIVQVLYIVGGLIIFSGISWLLSENWNVFGIGLKLLFTFGTSIIFLISGKILSDFTVENQQLSSLSLVSILVSFLTFPVGVGVSMNYFGFLLDRPLHVLVLSLAIMLFYLLAHVLLKYDVSLIFLIVSIVASYFAFAAYMLSDVYSANLWYLFAISTGVGFVLFGIWISRRIQGIFQISVINTLAHILFQGVGLLAICLSMFSLTGSDRYPSGFSEIFWEIIFLPFIAFVIFLSNKLKSNTMLVVGGIFLLAYIIKVVFRYLSDTALGTPGALLLAGVLVILTSYLLLRFRGLRETTS